MMLRIFLILMLQLNPSHSFTLNSPCLPLVGINSPSCNSILHYTNHETTCDSDVQTIENDVKHKVAAINAIPLSLNKKQIMSLPSNERYQYRIKQLLHYNQTHGTLDVPYNYPDDPQLAKWVITQRYEYKLLTLEKIGVKSYLTPERVEILNAIRFPWDREPASEEERAGLTKRWMAKWELLKMYKGEYGHIQIPESCIYRGVKLGVWLNNQRKSVWMEPNSFKTKVKVKKLNELGSAWDSREDAMKKETLYNFLWMERYDELKTFYLQHGHFNVPTESELSIWVRSQRVLYRQYRKNNKRRNDSYNGCYMQARIELMNEIGFDWDGRKSMEFRRNETWWETYEEAKGFYTCYGHLDVSSVLKKISMETTSRENRRSHNFDIEKLDQWLRTQRSLYNRRMDRNDQNTTLTDDRISALSTLGIVWNRHEYRWQQRLQDLKSFEKVYGHFKVPTVKLYGKDKSTYEDKMKGGKGVKSWADLIQLGRWARAQRAVFRKYERNSNSFSPAIQRRMAQLDEIGFFQDSQVPDDCISAPRGASVDEKTKIWDRNFAVLEEFHARNGHCYVSSDDLPEYKVLYEWISLQRHRFRTIKKQVDQNRFVTDVDLERLEKLQSLGFIWNQNDHKFHRNLNRLKAYRTKFGHIRVPSRWEDPNLYTFVRKQRELYRARESKGAKNSLSDERIRELDSIGFIWFPGKGKNNVE